MKEITKRKIRWWLKKLREKARRINELEIDDELKVRPWRYEEGNNGDKQHKQDA